MNNNITFEFDKIQKDYRKDIFTVKGLKENFADLDIIPIPTDLLEKQHFPYLFGLEQLNLIYDTINKQNEDKFPHLREEHIINIIPLADFLGLDILINYCLREIIYRILIKNKNIFKLLLDYPQFRENNYEYSKHEIQYIMYNYSNYDESFVKLFPDYLKINLIEEGVLLYKEAYYLKSFLVNYNQKHDLHSLKTFFKSIYQTVSNNTDIYNINFFKKCITYIKYSVYPTIKEENNNIYNPLLSII